MAVGRKLGELHVNYESVEPWPGTLDTHGKKLTDADYRVEKMRFASKEDKSTIIYNPKITIKDIPLQAYEYVVNGKSAIEWVMKRQGVSVDKYSGIVNDPTSGQLKP